MRIRLNTDSPWVPRLAAALTALVGLVNIGSALTPDISWRGHLLLHVEALQTMKVFHALALPAGAALLLVSPYLLARRRRAMTLAIGLLIGIGVVNLLKGLDFEESLVGWATAAGIYAGRRAFTVIHEPITLRSAVWRVPLIGAFGIALVSIADWVAHPRANFDGIVDESGALLRDRPGALRFDSERIGAFHHYLQFAWVPLAVHLVEVGTLLAIAYVIFRPLGVPRSLPGAAARRLAVDVVRRHGRDTLSFFKLRPDKHYFFSEDRSAFVGYRVEAGVLLLSGDPVGPAEQFPELLRQVRAFARARGLKMGAVSVSEATVPFFDEIGLQTMYMGDEALIELDGFSLEGRAIRKVRQSVTRLTKAGYSSALYTLETLEPETLAQIERVLELGRQGAPERGFSMGMDSIRGAADRDTLFVVARDGEHRVRGVLHFVPCYGRPAASLSMMRRDPETPNGLTEFLVCEAVVHLRERGLSEMSLNFATAARYMHDPHGLVERALGLLAIKLDRYFQVERLYRFNAKFFPRWEPRYLVYEGRLGFPRTFLGAMWAEGQIGKPALPRMTVRRRAAHKSPALPA